MQDRASKRRLRETKRDRVLRSGAQTDTRQSTKHNNASENAGKVGVSLYDEVSLAGLKEWARKLPDSSLVRELVLEMNDSMPRWGAVGQMCLLDRLLSKELKS